MPFPNPVSRPLAPFLSLQDPRVFQITFQAALLVTGLIVRKFSITPLQIALCFMTGSLTQWGFVRAFRLQNVGYKSALITCFGLCLFLRTDNLWVHPLAAFLGIASKFLIRAQGKHIFNPSNFGAILALLVFPSAWLTPGQWGYNILMASWCVALGSIVVLRAQRNDISWTFLVFYLGVIGMRVFLKEQDWTAWIYEINGALLIFTFFMISDPMTIPNRRSTRIIYAALVATVAYLLQFEFYQLNARIWNTAGKVLTSSSMAANYHTNGLLFALFLCSPLVPLLDRIRRGEKYEWKKPVAGT
jgi:enediyne biosynthesis protein E5